MQVLTLLKKQTLKIWRSHVTCRSVHQRWNKYRNKQKNYFQQKNTISRNIRGKSGRELGSDCSAETKRELALGCMWEASVPIGGGTDLASTGWPVADPGCIFTSYKGESWHHNLKTFILDEGGSGKGGEENSVTVLAVSGRVEHDMGPSSALPLCEALGRSLELRSLVHEEGIVVVVLSTTSQEC